MEIGKFKVTTGELTGATLTIVGLITAITAKSLGATAGFWNIYTVGFIVTGLITLGIGLLITLFSILKSHTTLLDLKCSIDTGTLGIILAVSIIAVIAINILVLPKLPNKPEDEIRRLPPTIAAMTRAKEHNFRIFFSLSIIIAGIAVSSVPAVKFFKN